MPTALPDDRPTATGAFARTTITVVMAVIAALAFVFSFGNVWTLALRLGVPRPIAPLIAPMVDLSVVGLLVALHHLAAHGTDPAHLHSATRLMHLCGLLTLTLNTAEPLLARHYGRAALDTVAPALLLGWGTVGPTLLRHLHAPRPLPRSERSVPPIRATSSARSVEHASANASPTSPASVPTRTENTKHSASGKRTGRPPAATMEQLIAIARPAIAEHGISGTVVKKALRDADTPISSARFTELMQHMRGEQVPAPATRTPEAESARAHPTDA